MSLGFSCSERGARIFLVPILVRACACISVCPFTVRPSSQCILHNNLGTFSTNIMCDVIKTNYAITIVSISVS